MSSITINVKSALGLGQIDNEMKTSADLARPALIKISQLFEKFACGVESGVIDVQSSTTSPVAASGTITLTYANIDANDTVTIGGQVLTAKASGATAGTEFNKTTDATVTAANLTTAINANTTLSKYFIATSALGVVTVTALVKGSIGNYLIQMATSDATAFALVQLVGGTGGPEGTPVSYTR